MDFKKVINLITSVFNNSEVEFPQDIDFNDLFNFAQSQQIVNLIYLALKKSKNFQTNQIINQALIGVWQNSQRSEMQVSEADKILEAFSKNGIDHMPLKGVRLKKLYPSHDLRLMSDCDILVKTEQYEKIKPIMESLGFTFKTESDHEYVWIKNTIYVELHKCLIPSYNKDYYAYFGDGWSKAHETDSPCLYEMTKEDEFIYILTHFAKHYRDGGIGIKHLLDLWVFLNTYKNLDNEYLEKNLKEIKLYKFYQNILSVLDNWFNNGEETEITRIITEVVFTNGSFGTEKNHIISSALRESKERKTTAGARVSHILAVSFPNLKVMELKYPILKKAPVLLPFLWIHRGFTAFIFRRHNVSKQMDILQQINGDEISDYKAQLNFVGLDFNFPEE